VDTVIVDGEVVMRNKKLTRVNKEEVVLKLKESLSAPLKPHEAQRAALSRELLPYIQRWFAGWRLQQGAPHYAYNERG